MWQKSDWAFGEVPKWMPVRGGPGGKENQGLGPGPHSPRGPDLSSLELWLQHSPDVWQVLSELLPLKPPGEPHKGSRCILKVSRPVWDQEQYLTLILQIQF